ncbi:MAG: serine/threonine protein kinase [Acidobacteria bacterium]|nr:serine/threonine protein kinase [Acidobacteriota bacterium]
MKVVEWGFTAADAPYLAMEFIEGPTLADVLCRSGPLPLDRAIAIAVSVADALVEAHRLGIVHRDLKPANIRLATPHGGDPVREGAVKVVDFGLARAMHDPQQHLTRAGVTLGTLAYMSPEQLVSGELAGPKSDVFALGCILYEMLTGKQAFAEEPFSRIGRDSPTNLRELRADVSSRLDRVVRRSMERSPSARMPSAEEFRIALRTSTGGCRRAAAVRWAAVAFLALTMGIGGSRSAQRQPTAVAQQLPVTHESVSQVASTSGATFAAIEEVTDDGTAQDTELEPVPDSDDFEANVMAHPVRRRTPKQRPHALSKGVRLVLDEESMNVFDVRIDSDSESLSSRESNRPYIVQFAALLSASAADSVASTIHLKGVPTRVLSSEAQGALVHRVVAGPFKTRKEAQRVAQSSKRDAFVYSF